MTKTLKNLIVLSAVLFLTACGGKFSGTYADPSGALTYTFSSDGKVIQSGGGLEVEMNYEVDGDKVKLKGNDGMSMVLPMVDGKIVLFDGTTLSKRE